MTSHGRQVGQAARFTGSHFCFRNTWHNLMITKAKNHRDLQPLQIHLKVLYFILVVK